MRLAELYRAVCRPLWVLTFFVVLSCALSPTILPAWSAPLTQSTSPQAASGVVSATARVNLRGGPGVDYLVLAKLDPGAAITVISTNRTQDWLRVRVDNTGRTGWLAADLVQLAAAHGGSLALLPTPTPDVLLSTNASEQRANPATAETDDPPTTSSSAALIPTPTPMVANAITDAPTAQPLAETASASGEPQAITRPPNMNVRGGPGVNHPVVTVVQAGTTLPILALATTGDWYKVEVDGQAEAWVSAALVQASGSLDGLPQLSVEQAPAAAALAAAVESAPVTSSSLAPVAVASAPPPSGGGFFAYGIQAHLWQNSEKPFVAGQIRELGFSWVKSQLRWEFVENSPGAVNWSEPDQIIEVMNGHGINVLFSVFTAPHWTRPDKPGTGGPPDDFNLYADFVGKVAQRYCGRLGAIEIWNEQNLQREWEGYPLDPAQYMDLLRRAYSAIKANCPSILVISGAPTPSGNSPVAVDDVAYLAGMYANGLANYSDGVGVHPSGFANPPEATIQDWQAGRYTAPASHFDHRSFYFRSTMEEYRNVMVANGDVNKRLWPTEFGWGSTSTPHPGYEYEAYITESTQAQYIVRAYLLMREWGWVGVPFLWNLNFSEGEMAAFRVVGRPAYEALKTLPK